MRAAKIRSTFLDYFVARGHQLWPSSSLVPDDPTLLLTTAGMVQFKPYLLGEATAQQPRATSVQKCARTTDIENVGVTARHATFFEMLGNFSFGDYFKADAIGYAYDLLTAGFGLDVERLWVTVYESDDVAASLWREVGMPASRIQRRGADDNFWSMGVAGPCGPSSEIYFDRGPRYGAEGGPIADEERYLEIWNLVFMESLRDDAFSIVGELPRKSIDTGMGLERMAIVLQDVPDVFSTDLLAPILARVEEVTSTPFSRDARSDVSLRVVTEHTRTAAFLIADGVVPSNEGRGYVLRRLVRRAVRHSRALAPEQATLERVGERVLETLGEAWPELERQRDAILTTLAEEESSFARTLASGQRLLAVELERLVAATPVVDAATSAGDMGANMAATSSPAPGATLDPSAASAVPSTPQGSAQVLAGTTAFVLHDTYGFPFELTLEVAREAGIEVDRSAFEQEMQRQRRRSKQGRLEVNQEMTRLQAYRELAAELGASRFVGYDRSQAEAQVLAVLRDGEVLDAAVEGDEVDVVLDVTPFYAEGGGQVGDRGALALANAARFEVSDTRTVAGRLIVHHGIVRSGEVVAGVRGQASIDAEYRAAVARSHTATHVLHWALRAALGEHAAQRGSLVDAGRLRFDFAHSKAPGADVLERVEVEVNARLLDDATVRVWEASIEEARASGAIALFGERYGEVVRIVDIGSFSRELCGGTHVGHASQVGPVRIVGEASVGAGLRRIEALTGADALAHGRVERRLLEEAAILVRTRPEHLGARIQILLEELERTRTELERLREVELQATAARLATTGVVTDDGWMVVTAAPVQPAATLRRTVQEVLAKAPLPRALVVAGCAFEGKAALVAAVSPALVAQGVRARDLLMAAAKAVGGGAGGSPELASAGGRNADHLDEALGLARRAASDALRADR